MPGRALGAVLRRGCQGESGINDALARAAGSVMAEIEALVGQALANDSNVSDSDPVCKLVRLAKDRWGRSDALVNTSGNSRDRIFA